MSHLINAPVLLKLTAFTTSVEGGNPAGVWIGDELPSPGAMQQIAADVGYSETAFVAPANGPRRTVRYFSPEAEVPFCGHATVAAGVAIGQRDGTGSYLFDTAAGPVGVDVSTDSGHYTATLTSVDPRHEAVPDNDLAAILSCLNWAPSELDTAIPPVRAFAGAWHLILAARHKQRLDDLDYDFQSLKQQMLASDLTTLQLIWRESETLIHSRNPFPVGGVVEDPATGAAAAALGGYLRDANIVATPASLTIQQGIQMGRPSLLRVDIPENGGIRVTGNAVVLEDKS